MRLMSFAHTTPAIRDRTKTVTRRDGWRFLRPGDRLCAIDKSPRAGRGFERLAVIEVVSVRREKLLRLALEPHYSFEEMRREGLPHIDPRDFVASMGGCDHEVTRIEFRYVEEE